jgi:hypothetical protein
MDDTNAQPVDGPDVAGAERLMAKLRHFIRTELDDGERAMLATLLAPGVAEAHEPRAGDDDVVGFGADATPPMTLPEHLAQAVRGSGIRIVVEK